MKKITLLTVALAAMTLGSCKKDYTCECTTSYTVGSTTTTTVTDIKAHTSKKDAQAFCDAVPKATETVNGTSVTNSTPPTCTVK